MSDPPVSEPQVSEPQDGSSAPGTNPVEELGPGLQQNLMKAGFLVALLAVAGMLVWILGSLLAGATLQAVGEPGPAAAPASAPPPPATPRPSLPVKGVRPLDFRVGDCFKDFDASAADATVVACTSGHSAQLVAIHRYPAGDSFPGAKEMKAKGREACQAAKLNSKTNAYVLTYQLAYPSPDSWRQGDRRVDCYITSASGNIIKTSLLP
ncbi:septum formation family protein [Arthrobacter sp. NPDC093139]|uniref:septum formation family protein n=1 Tax=Arthrobacter sp. NPDC093139 TaxID=3363945 RepID=UPI0037FC4948